MRQIRLILVLFVTIFLVACVAGVPETGPKFSNTGNALRILGSPPFEVLRPAIERFNKENKANVQLETVPSIEIKDAVENGAKDIDVVAPSDSRWIDMANESGLVKYDQSTFQSPIVLAVAKSKAQELNIVGREATIKDFVSWVSTGKIRLAMPSGTQSNVGMAAMVAFISGLKNHPGVYLSSDLQDQTVRASLRQIFSVVDRSSSRSDQLKDQFVTNYPAFTGMINYEAYALQANLRLVEAKKEPLHLVYLTDATAIAEFPFGLVDRGDKSKQELYKKFLDFLKSDQVQKEIHEAGWRTGFLGATLEDNPPAIFDPSIGVKKEVPGSGLIFPNTKVLLETMVAYQTVFRRGTLFIWAIDFSGSMQTNYQDKSGKTVKRVDALKAAMKTILDPSEAAKASIQRSQDDVTVVVPFCADVIYKDGEEKSWTVKGNNPQELLALLRKVDQQNNCGATAIYSASIRSIEIAKKYDLTVLSPAIVLMTDGQNECAPCKTYDDLVRLLANPANTGIPIYTVLFGDAVPLQLQNIAKSSKGEYWDGRTDLSVVFRRVVGQSN